MAKTRQPENIFLLGVRDLEPLNRFNTLPTTKEVLLRFHHHLNDLKSVRNASHRTIDELMVVWSKAAIPTRLVKHAIDKLENIHSEWLLLKKNKCRLSDAQREREHKFLRKVNELFDIAHANVMTMIKLEEDRKFLIDQRSERNMIMTTVNKKLAEMQERVSRHKKEEQARKEKASAIDKASSSISTIFSAASLSPNKSFSNSKGETEDEFIPYFAKRKHEKHSQQFQDQEQNVTLKKTLFTHHVTSALDRNNVSDREAVRIMVPIATALGENASSLSISQSTVQRVRKKARRQFVEEVVKNYAPKYPIIIHWDSKILPDIVGRETVDRLPIIVSGDGEEKLLGVPKLSSGTGINAAHAIYKKLEQWDLVNKVIGMSFDTTSVNTGHLNGTCTLLEGKIGRDLLWLACRHHTLELILAKVFALCFGPSSSPEIPLFKRFKKVWHEIVRNNFQILEVAPELVSFKESALSSLCNLNKTIKVPRDDYQELIELTNTVLGKPPEKIHWRAPGPVHHARWMSKLIYGIKIYLFCNQKDVVNLTKREEAQLEKFVKFGALIYAKAWIAAPLASEAPYIDLKLWKDLKEYELFDFEISNAANCVLERHLGYLSDELVGLALFSDTVLTSEKDAMVKMIKSKPMLRNVRGNCNILKTNQEVNLSDFVSERSVKLFEKLNIDNHFLTLPSKEWKWNTSYLQGRERVKKLQVVNDTAERGVKLFQEFNTILTKDEEEKQFLLQVVETNRKAVSSKSTKKHIFDAAIK